MFEEFDTAEPEDYAEPTEPGNFAEPTPDPPIEAIVSAITQQTGPDDPNTRLQAAMDIVQTQTGIMRTRLISFIQQLARAAGEHPEMMQSFAAASASLLTSPGESTWAHPDMEDTLGGGYWDTVINLWGEAPE